MAAELLIKMSILLFSIGWATAGIAGAVYYQAQNQQKQQQDPAESSVEIELLPSASMYKLDACLLDVTGRHQVCDPDRILTNAQLAMINEELAELQRATNTSFFPAPPLWQFMYASKCPQSGLAFSLILLKDITQPGLAQKMAIDFHGQYTLAHPCEKTAVGIINLGAARQGGGTAGMFTAMASHNTDLGGKELSRYFYQQSNLLRTGQIGEALREMIEDIRRNMMLRM